MPRRLLVGAIHESPFLTAFRKYVAAINEALRGGPTTELTHRRALQDLLEALGKGVSTTNEPGRIEDSSPDVLVRKGEAIVGYVETKNIGVDLAKWPRSKQGKKYLATFDNLLLTDYVNFQWFVEVKSRDDQSLGRIKDGKMATTSDGLELVLQVISDFLSHKPELIARADDLARKLATKAQRLRDLVAHEMTIEKDSGFLHRQLRALRRMLIPKLKDDEFADLYAQTLTYGIFASRVEHSRTPTERFRFSIAQEFLPRANPFLREMFHLGAFRLHDIEEVAWIIDDIAQLLAFTDISEIIKDFGKRMRREDPIVDLYETFLKHYNPKEKKRRGVYFTPEPVVSYIVRSIDELLKERFNKTNGLADPSVLILDPAVGTGTFLYHTVKLIREHVEKKMGRAAWQPYVRKHLIPRLFGFELMMAPYVISHIKLGLQLAESGYQFGKGERLRIYLTDTLKDIPTGETTEEIGFAEYIAREGDSAKEVKRENPIVVIMGNPPYSRFARVESEEMEALLRLYKDSLKGERNIQPLANSYVQFMRFAHDRVCRTRYGIVGMITDNSYIWSLIHRSMRSSLMKDFDDIYVLNLHGGADEVSPSGVTDENVFDIREAVGITILSRHLEHEPAQTVSYKDLWGTRQEKEKFLADPYITAGSVDHVCVSPTTPSWFFTPKDFSREPEYHNGVRVSDLFGVSGSGVKTHRDHFVIDFNLETLVERMAIYRNLDKTDEDIRRLFELRDTRDWKMSGEPKGKTGRRRAYANRSDWKRYIRPILYRPFDKRFIAYSDEIVELPRRDVMRHMLAPEVTSAHDRPASISDAWKFKSAPNVALVCNRTTALDIPFTHVTVSDTIVDVRALPDLKGAPFAFPLYVRSKDVDGNQELKSNFKNTFIQRFEKKLNVYKTDEEGRHRQTLEPRAVFGYIYAILHSLIYRDLYADFLKTDFPWIPLTCSLGLFTKLAKLGDELVQLHLLKHEMLDEPGARIQGSGDRVIRKVNWHEVSKRVYINETQYFEGVKQRQWDFRIGAHRVLHEWLNHRKRANRKLSYDEIETYCKIVTAIDETIRLMAEIDRAIPKWPIE